MNEIEFAGLLVSRVCHDLVSPVGAVINGLEVLEDERDATMRADALRLVMSSAEQAAARLQFARIAFGAAGSAGAELDLGEVGRIVKGLLLNGKVTLHWRADPVHWPKDWAKLLMNAAMVASESLPRGGEVSVDTAGDATAPRFTVRATGQNARMLEEMERAARGEAGVTLDSRSIQPFLLHKLSRSLNAGLTLTMRPGEVEIVAG
jgi:histidine phosphotransferase ChpT